MACNKLVFSRVQIEFNGTNLDIVSDGAELSFGGVVSEAGKTTVSGKHYPSTKVEPGEFKCEIPMNEDFNLDDFRDVCGLLTIIGDGKTYVMRNAMVSSNMTATVGESIVAVEFVGDQVEDIG